MHPSTGISDPEAAPSLKGLTPDQARRAQEIMAHMPEGRDPTAREEARSRGWFVLLSVIALLSLVGILLLVGRDLSSIVAVLLITLGYAFGLLPLIGAAIYRRRDREQAVDQVRESTV